MGTPAKCLPSATALGATFDPELINTVGVKLIAQEARLKAASVLLGPTVNTQRSPLGGRSNLDTSRLLRTQPSPLRPSST